MPKIVVSNKCIAKGCTKAQKNKIKERLTFDNPKYISAIKSGRFVPRGMPQKLFFYEETPHAIVTPKGMAAWLCKTLHMTMDDVTDRTIAPGMSTPVKESIQLRDYQQKAMKDVLSFRFGILEAATGSGKTAMGVYSITQRKTKTLIIVHNKELLKQWISSIKKFTTCKEVGVIGDGKYQVKDITVGIINSVYKKISQISGEFGYVIVDECHRAASDTYVHVLNNLKCKYQLGLSATPYRSDKLTNLLFELIGPLRHRVDKGFLEVSGAILVPRIVRINTGFSYNRGNVEYSQLMTALTTNEERNVLIAQNVLAEFTKHKEPMMIVSDRVTHCEELHGMLDGVHGINSVVLSSKLPKAYREEAIKQLKDGHFNTLISTVALLGEGFDYSEIGAVHLTTPVKFSGRLIQVVGRSLRPSNSNEKPRIYDYRDTLVPMLRYSGFARDRVYKKNNWT